MVKKIEVRLKEMKILKRVVAVLCVLGLLFFRVSGQTNLDELVLGVKHFYEDNKSISYFGTIQKELLFFDGRSSYSEGCFSIQKSDKDRRVIFQHNIFKANPMIFKKTSFCLGMDSDSAYYCSNHSDRFIVNQKKEKSMATSGFTGYTGPALSIPLKLILPDSKRRDHFTQNDSIYLLADTAWRDHVCHRVIFLDYGKIDKDKLDIDEKRKEALSGGVFGFTHELYINSKTYEVELIKINHLSSKKTLTNYIVDFYPEHYNADDFRTSFINCCEEDEKE